MSEALATVNPEKTVSVVRGQYHKFMLIPIMDHHAEFFPAGPVTFGIEARVLANSNDVVGERGASLHVFNTDRSEEYLRFDCFEKVPHYHYILQKEQHNIVWGYDSDANGPMLPWVLNRLRTRVPDMLRKAGAIALAGRVEREGFDMGVVDKLETAMKAAWDSTFPGTDMIEEGRNWCVRWKTLHPEFNTVEDG